ncbi:MAG: RDD family protein [Gammaproteobacteria bacterium]|nr:RDD family protein [Gammaproteobacteria bacterium]
MHAIDDLYVPSITGVDLQLRIASLGGRSYAFVIDWHIRTVAALAWYMASASIVYQELVVPKPDATFYFVVVAPTTAIYFLYHLVLEVATGRTPGKRIAGVRIVSVDGQPPGVGALAIRNVLRILDSLLFYSVGLISVLVTRQSVRIGDIAAGTLLVYDDDPKTDTGRFNEQAVARLGLERAELAHELLDRWKALEPERRQALARKLLDDGSERSDYALHEALKELVR